MFLSGCEAGVTLTVLCWTPHSNPTAVLGTFPLLLHRSLAQCVVSLPQGRVLGSEGSVINLSQYLHCSIPSSLPQLPRNAIQPRDLLPFSAFHLLLENFCLIFMPVIIQGEKGKAWEAQSENKPAHFSAVTLFKRCCASAEHLLPFSFTFALWVEVILQKSWDGALDGSTPALQGLGSAAFAAQIP